MERTDLVDAKKQIKEMYLQNLLNVKNNEEIYKGKVDPLVEAYLQGKLIEFLDQMEHLPGFENFKGLLGSQKGKERSSKAGSKKNQPSQDENKHRKEKKLLQKEPSKISATEDGANSVIKNSRYL